MHSRSTSHTPIGGIFPFASAAALTWAGAHGCSPPTNYPPIGQSRDTCTYAFQASGSTGAVPTLPLLGVLTLLKTSTTAVAGSLSQSTSTAAIPVVGTLSGLSLSLSLDLGNGNTVIATGVMQSTFESCLGHMEGTLSGSGGGTGSWSADAAVVAADSVTDFPSQSASAWAYSYFQPSAGIQTAQFVYNSAVDFVAGAQGPSLGYYSTGLKAPSKLEITAEYMQPNATNTLFAFPSGSITDRNIYWPVRRWSYHGLDTTVKVFAQVSRPQYGNGQCCEINDPVLGHPHCCPFIYMPTPGDVRCSYSMSDPNVTLFMQLGGTTPLQTLAHIDTGCNSGANRCAAPYGSCKVDNVDGQIDDGVRAIIYIHRGTGFSPPAAKSSLPDCSSPLPIDLNQGPGGCETYLSGQSAGTLDGNVTPTMMPITATIKDDTVIDFAIDPCGRPGSCANGMGSDWNDTVRFTATVVNTANPPVITFWPVSSTWGKQIYVSALPNHPAPAFINGTTVLFGGDAKIPSPGVTVLSPTLLSVTVPPASAGNVNGYLTVQVPDGNNGLIMLNSQNAEKSVPQPLNYNSTYPSFILWGDLNGDGQLNMPDLMLAQSILANQIIPTSQQRLAADVFPALDSYGMQVRGDGQLTLADQDLLQLALTNQQGF